MDNSRRYSVAPQAIRTMAALVILREYDPTCGSGGFGGSGHQGASLIRYTKRYSGQTYHVEEVRTKRKELAFKTLRRTRTTKLDAAPEAPLALTSETVGRNPSQGEGSVTVAQGGDKDTPAAPDTSGSVNAPGSSVPADERLRDPNIQGA